MLEISERDVIVSLKRDNPWWENPENPGPNFVKRRAYFETFKRLVMGLKVRRTVILMGPRRVGKTVLLQQLIGDLIEGGFPSSNILFASIDTPLYTGMALERLLQLFLNNVRQKPHSAVFVIFDEIQYLKDWEVHLKVLTDRYQNIQFIASGSAAAALRLKSTESGAGRFTDFFLPPLTFAEFLDFRDVESELIQKIDRGPTMRYRTSDIEHLNREFINYLNFGGYPEAVLNENVQSNVQRYLGRDIIDKVLLRDLPSLYGIQDIQELNRLFTTLAYHTAHEISLENLATSSGVAKNTIARYLEYLEAAFLIVRVERVDHAGRTFQRMRKFKVYLTNPSMRAALFAPVSEEDAALGALAETAIFSQWFHSDQMGDIHYARWKHGRKDLEVDLVKVAASTLKPVWAYDIKWSDRHIDRPAELEGLIEFAKKNRQIPIGATTRSKTAESIVDDVTIKQFPCALHCYQIGRNVIEGRPA